MIRKQNMAAVSIPENYEPAFRLRNLGQLGSNVTIEKDVPARRYLRSALEMEKMVKSFIHEFLYACGICWVSVSAANHMLRPSVVV